MLLLEAVHTAIYVSSCYCNMCPHATGYVSSCYWVCVLMLLIYVSSCYYRCVVYYYMQRPHTATSRPSYYRICVLMLLQYMCRLLLYVAHVVAPSYCYISALILPHMRPHATTIYVSSTTIRSTRHSSLILLHLGPHTTAYASSCYYNICVVYYYT
jgi:hypothetical protein